MPHVATSRGHWGSSLYTGSKPRRQSDKLLATICASFRLVRVNAHGGTVGACDNVVDSKPEGDLTSDVEAREGDMHPQTKMAPGPTMFGTWLGSYLQRQI